MTGFKRSKRKQDPHVAILAIKVACIINFHSDILWSHRTSPLGSTLIFILGSDVCTCTEVLSDHPEKNPLSDSFLGKKKVAGRKGSKVKTNMRRIWGRFVVAPLAVLKHSLAGSRDPTGRLVV